MRALGMYVFGGSATIGVLNSGVSVDRVLEITDEMLEQNAKHFIHNFPNIPVIKPSEWDNENYIEKLKEENYDLLYGNPPCSGLSQINRNASADNEVNKHMYKFLDVVSKVRPKTFIMENAPTLISKGKPILDEFAEKLESTYLITIIRDFAGNHNVCMKRQRTLVIGWRRDTFKSIPGIEPELKRVNFLEVTKDISSNAKNMELVPERTLKDLDFILKDMPENTSIMTHVARNYDRYKSVLPEKYKESALRIKNCIENRKGYFDKSPYRIPYNSFAPSLASVIELIHPVEHRPLYIREYARMMGYPDNFEFIECNTPIIQCIAQGVPANFITWITTQVMKALIEAPEQEISLDGSDIRYVNYCSGRFKLMGYGDTETFIRTKKL